MSSTWRAAIFIFIRRSKKICGPSAIESEELKDTGRDMPPSSTSTLVVVQLSRLRQPARAPVHGRTTHARPFAAPSFFHPFPANVNGTKMFAQGRVLPDGRKNARMQIIVET